jgi:hypothetical protein
MPGFAQRREREALAEPSERANNGSAEALSGTSQNSVLPPIGGTV